MSDPFILLLLTVMVVLLLVIVVLARVVIQTAGDFLKKQNAEEANPSPTTLGTTVLFALILFSALPVTAQEKVVAKSSTLSTNLSPTTFWSLVAVIGIELLVIFVLVSFLKVFLNKAKQKEVLAEAMEYDAKPRISLWARINNFRPIAQESQIEMEHSYDGIRELDNRLPPWWLYGFYLTIIFAVVYLWRFHVSHTGLSSEQEFQLAMKQADEQKQAYLKNAANNVDETTVTFSTDASVNSAGKAVFVQNCAPCHGKDGEGVVGPNLTDDYWLHGGNIKDIFKSIKYGWPEKGMKSWKDDLSASQIAQLANFIKSIHGSHPQNGKEQQGDLYTEKTDSTATQ